LTIFIQILLSTDGYRKKTQTEMMNNTEERKNELLPTRRFGASGGAAPQKRQCSFSSSPPARASVSRRLRQAAWALGAGVFISLSV
jgi:hypothetical protein